MKVTGIVRYMDDLGRICVPKEMRKMANVKEGDPFEIFVGDQTILFKLYDPEHQKIERKLCEVMDELNILCEYDLQKEVEQLLEKITKKLSVDEND